MDVDAKAPITLRVDETAPVLVRVRVLDQWQCRSQPPRDGQRDWRDTSGIDSDASSTGQQRRADASAWSRSSCAPATSWATDTCC